MRSRDSGFKRLDSRGRQQLRRLHMARAASNSAVQNARPQGNAINIISPRRFSLISYLPSEMNAALMQRIHISLSPLIYVCSPKKMGGVPFLCLLGHAFHAGLLPMATMPPLRYRRRFSRR